MIRTERLAWATRLVVVGAVLLAGCRSIPLPRPPVEDVAPERKDRKTLAVQQFEQNRNFAEFQAAQAAHDRGDLRNSQAGLESLLRRDPGHRDARLLLATVLSEQAHDSEALAQLQTALDDFPNDPDVHRAMAGLMQKLERPEEAWAHLDRAASLAARQAPALAGAPGAAGPVIPASACVNDDVGAVCDGGNNRAVGAAAAGLLRQGEKALADNDSERALGCFRQAAAYEPGNPHIPTAAAVAALRQDRPQTAVDVAHDALVTFPRWTPLLRTLGTAYYRQGDYESSQLVLRQALSLDKSDALAYFLLGCTHLKLGQFDDAEACFADARRIDPSLPAETAHTERDVRR